MNNRVVVRAYDSWTDDEEQALGQHVVNEITKGNSLQNALNVFADETGRSVGGVQYRWATTVKKMFKEQYQTARTTAQKTPKNTRVKSESSQLLGELDEIKQQRDELLTLNSKMEFFLKSMGLFEEFKTICNS